ncbi:MAG TPA: DMT family protein [Chitinophagales bacterium]|nr:DMT family protein [Chitinophagales bacterium]
MIQEVISVFIFIKFAYFFLGEKLKWNYAVSFVFLFLAVYFVFKR